jgi:hypothetical protein
MFKMPRMTTLIKQLDEDFDQFNRLTPEEKRYIFNRGKGKIGKASKVAVLPYDPSDVYNNEIEKEKRDNKGVVAVFLTYKNHSIFSYRFDYSRYAIDLTAYGDDLAAKYNKQTGKKFDEYVGVKSLSGFTKLCNNVALMLTAVLGLKKNDVTKNMRFLAVYEDTEMRKIHQSRYIPNKKTVTVNGITTPSDQELESGVDSIKQRLKDFVNNKIKNITDFKDLPRKMEELNKDGQQLKIRGFIYKFDDLFGSFSNLFNNSPRLVGVHYKLEKVSPEFTNLFDGAHSRYADKPENLFFTFKLIDNHLEVGDIYVSGDDYFSGYNNAILGKSDLLPIDTYFKFLDSLYAQVKNGEKMSDGTYNSKLTGQYQAFRDEYRSKNV